MHFLIHDIFLDKFDVYVPNGTIIYHSAVLWSACLAGCFLVVNICTGNWKSEYRYCSHGSSWTNGHGPGYGNLRPLRRLGCRMSEMHGRRSK